MFKAYLALFLVALVACVSGFPASGNEQTVDSVALPFEFEPTGSVNGKPSMVDMDLKVVLKGPIEIVQWKDTPRFRKFAQMTSQYLDSARALFAATEKQLVEDYYLDEM